jgi:hypothetical protein
MPTLLIAAGGGGDAIAAAMLAADPAILGDTVCGIASYSWDRLLVDPLPGPRIAEDFTGLDRLGDHTYVVTEHTRPVRPAGSTLPRLAADLPTPLLLLDPQGGSAGLQRQISSAATSLAATRILLLDVGGDIIATGNEAALRSPLADSLAAAACTGLDIPVDVAIAGPGLDGELTADYVRTAVQGVDGQLASVLGPAHARQAAAMLDWHPSEVSGLLAAAADGAQGVVEIRDTGTPITMDRHSAEVWRMSLDAVATRNLLVAPLAATTTLAEAESVVRFVCGRCEIDYERAKAAARNVAPASQRTSSFTLAGFENAVHNVETAAAARGADYTTLRRLIEMAGGIGGNHDRLRAHLARRWPERYQAPLWRVGP